MPEIAGQAYTVSGCIDPKSDAGQYFLKYLPFFSAIERRMFHDLTSGFYDQFNAKPKYVSYVMKHFGVMKRTVNSLMHMISGKIESVSKLKNLNIAALELKIHAISKRISDLDEKTNEIRIVAR